MASSKPNEYVEEYSQMKLNREIECGNGEKERDRRDPVSVDGED